MLFSDSDRSRIGAAITAAEARTAGEIVVIVSTSEHRYPATALSIAALLAFAVPLAAVLGGWNPGSLIPDWEAIDRATQNVRDIESFVAVQSMIFVGVLALLYFTGLGRALTPHGLRRDRVHRAALTQFKARGLEATIGRTGVLIYVDEPEHIAEVVADTAIYAKVKPGHWGATITALTAGIKAGTAANGMIDAIGLCGAVLSEHFPQLPDDTNELPDRLIEI
ncbi:MAG: TPM domain-containing protein [Sandarakinorhabdus sp.]|nr:TPM domain-containing protein [Sandarakinorhabdus sp.]